MPAIVAIAAALAGPDPAPALSAVQTCDRAAMSGIIRGEPHRRAEFAAAIYAEQQAISRDRAALYARLGGDITLAGKTSLETGLAQLDARQRQLEDSRAVERSWRDMVDELRADFLTNCASGKGGIGG
ncbi:MAG: hypothetical protein ACKOOL_02990 [Novosphingobium sp.]